MSMPERVQQGRVEAGRVAKWAKRFAGYRETVTKHEIEEWINQFGEHLDIGCVLLDKLDYFDNLRIATTFRSAIGSLPEWDHASVLSSPYKWRFVAMSGSAGESGNSMLHQFRIATRLDHKRYNQLFIERSALVKENLNQDHRVVLIDDWSGTGQQVCAAWNDKAVSFAELTAGAGSTYLVLVAATAKARARIASETDMSVVLGKEVGPEGDVFDDAFAGLSVSQKDELLRLCRIADKKRPKGFGDCGLLVVFQHRAPNNSLPVLHTAAKGWVPLFPRND